MFDIVALYTISTIPSVINAEITPIIIPSIINGPLIKPFVAPTYFIIDISFLLAYTVSFIVYEIIKIEIIISNTSSTNVIVWIDWAIFDKLEIVSFLVLISSTLSNFIILSCTSLFLFKSVSVTKNEAGNGLSSVYADSNSWWSPNELFMVANASSFE